MLLTSESPFIQMSASPVDSSSSDYGQAFPLISQRFPCPPLFSSSLLTISSQGNTGFRYFPSSGWLGLTPVRAEGGLFSFSFPFLFFPYFSSQVVRTKLDDDQKPLLAKSITISIRCYECRTRVAGNYSNVLVDQTQVLWSKQDSVDYDPVGNLELPFQISLPANVAGFSNAIFVDYRCVWRIEAGNVFSPFSLLFLLILL